MNKLDSSANQEIGKRTLLQQPPLIFVERLDGELYS